MQRNTSTRTFNKSVVERRDKSQLVGQIADLLKSNGITAEIFQTYDPSFKEWVFKDLNRRNEAAFGASRLVYILNTVHSNLRIAA